MSTPEISLLLERQLLLQLGDRLKRLRKAQGLGTVEMAVRVGITRNTLRAVEAGDPGPSMGTYLRVMSVLGIGGDLALLAGDTLTPPPPGSAAARSRRVAPVVQVRVSAEDASHRLHDLQSLALHEEAVQLAKANPDLVQKAQATVSRWLANGDVRSASLWREWQSILGTGAWRKALSRTRHAQQLRQASPLVTVLPEEMRQRVLQQVKALKAGIELDNMPRMPSDVNTETVGADIYPLQAPELADQIDGAIGEGSQFHQTYGYYAQGVGPDTAVLPSNWMQRVHRVQSGNTNDRVGYCLDLRDLFLAKATAGREKDREFCMALFEHGHVTPAGVLEFAPFMPLDNKQQRALRATIRRWAKAVRDAGHDLPEA